MPASLVKHHEVLAIAPALRDAAGLELGLILQVAQHAGDGNLSHRLQRQLAPVLRLADRPAAAAAPSAVVVECCGKMRIVRSRSAFGTNSASARNHVLPKTGYQV